MKDSCHAQSHAVVPASAKKKWRKLFKSRVARKNINSSETTEEYIEFESYSDKLSQ